jgi:ABC-type enterochelin transport system ATPase subunit
MANGRVVYHTTPDQLMTPEALAAIYDIEVDVREISGNLIGVYYR